MPFWCPPVTIQESIQIATLVRTYMHITITRSKLSPKNKTKDVLHTQLESEDVLEIRLAPAIA